MQTFDLLQGMEPALLELSASRWGVPASTPHLVAELLRTPAHAVRTCRRGADAGAGRLVRTMVEFGGHAVPLHENLRTEARLLEGWFPFTASDLGWRVPFDFAAAAIEAAESERFFAATLLGRCTDAQIRAVTVELGLPTSGSRNARAGRAAALIAKRALSADNRSAWADAIRVTAGLPALAADQILAVQPVAGAMGAVFEVSTRDGRKVIYAVREYAIAAGYALPALHFGPTPLPQRRMLKVRIPNMLPTGVLVTFSTLRATEEAVGIDEFRDMVAQRLDERRLVLQPGIEVRTVQALLSRVGFALSDSTFTSSGY
jgi:hypothetical protein